PFRARLARSLARSFARRVPSHPGCAALRRARSAPGRLAGCVATGFAGAVAGSEPQDRKSTRLNSSHVKTSYAVFCLKKKNGHLKTQKHSEDTHFRLHIEPIIWTKTISRHIIMKNGWRKEIHHCIGLFIAKEIPIP